MLKQTLLWIAIFLLGAAAAAAQPGQFVEAPQFATGVNPQAVASGDFRGDGKVDLVVANSTSNTISVLLGNGDGTFRAKVDYPTGSAPQGVAVGYFSNSGKLDIAVTDSASNTVSIFLGNGDGSFQKKVDYATGTQPWGIAVGDFNKDGNLDLVVTNAHDDTVSILLGKGDGTFNLQVGKNPPTTFNPVSVVVVDLNQDGNLDLAVAGNNSNNSISVLLGKGDGTFQTQLPFSLGALGAKVNPYSIVSADFNGDGFPDLAVANQQGNTVSVLLSNGKSGISWNLLAHVDYATAAFPTGIAAGDFNGDGHIDLAVSDGNGNSVSVLLGNGDGTFQAQTGYGTGDIPFSVIAADFNGDGKTDLAVANSGGNSVSVILGNGNGTFQTRIDYAAGPNPFAVATGDFNGDGVADLAVANRNCSTCQLSSSFSIMLGNGDGSFQPPTQFSTGTSTDPRAIAVGDLNGDKVKDLVVANYATGTVGVFLGNGDGTFSPGGTVPVGSGSQSQPDSIAIGDFNGDNIPDLAVANFHDGTVTVLQGNGNGTFSSFSGSPVTVGTGPIFVAAADLNGDKILDLVVVNESSNNATILLGNGDGTFTPKGSPPQVGGNPQQVVVGDFNGDGIPDLAFADLNTQTVTVLIGN
jgi:FG-GAP-like repeat